MGVGTLAGSTIMLLTIAWGGSLLAGRCDLGSRVRSHSLQYHGTHIVILAELAPICMQAPCCA